MAQKAWGDSDTQFFFALTPERILDAIEKSTGERCTGRAMALNSMENRVYEVEIERDEPPRNPSQNFLIAKFYRPGRWSRDQILDEHRFLQDLVQDEIPAVAPLTFLDGSTLHKLDDADIYYTVFPKMGGRSPDELNDDQLGRVGRLLARMHNVGATGDAEHRIRLTPEVYGRDNLRYLLDAKAIPLPIEQTYRDTVNAICDLSEPLFATVATQRIHGDGHLGNLLDGRDGLYWVDFDDMVVGPKVQDIWLLLPGRDSHAQAQLDTLLAGYQMMGDFDPLSLRLVEPLRALRFVHFSAWISKRWSDPAFPRAFPNFGTDRYWQDQLNDLREQLSIIQGL